MSDIGTGGIDPEWRKYRHGRTEKLNYILETKQFTDVTFRVGNATNFELIGAHRLVLSMYSGVFEAMFHGPLAPSDDEIIEIPDIDPPAFHNILKFVYSGEYQQNLPVDGAINVLYGSKKYDITDLELVCINDLKNQICDEHAVTILQAAQLLDVADLKEECVSYIIRNFDGITKTDDFLTISKSNLIRFLQDDETRGAELDIFYGALRWGKAECGRLNLPQDKTSYRKVLKDILPLVRFPVMSKEEIALYVVPTGVLTPEESTLLFQHLIVPHDNRHLLPELTFIEKKRTCSICIARFYDGMAKSPYVDISAGWFNKFSVDQAISIVSFGFYGPFFYGTSSYQVSIKLMKEDEVLGEVLDHIVEANSKEIFHVKFEKAISILPDIKYKAWFALKGALTCHGTSNSQTQEVSVPVSYTRYGRVNFTYYVTGAHQLPEIAFQI